jgi:RhtB (resistance to homoserine/threonine) family protein
MYLKEFLLVAGAHLLAVMSPGPDFAMITRNSLVYSRRSAVLSSAGLACGILVHVSYCLLGIGLVISRSILVFNIIKWAGAAYLVWIGIKSLRAKRHDPNNTGEAKTRDITTSQALRLGFLTNVLNPKATLFFLALFTQVINPETPMAIQVGYGLEMAIATFCWFALVATVLSHRAIKARFERVQHWLERAFGAILIAFGIRVAFSTQK